MNYEDRVTKEYVEGLLSGGAKFAFGSYVGDGAYGFYSRSSLTFDFEPKLVIIQGDQGSVGTFHSGIGIGLCMMSYQSFAINAAWNGNTFTWYHLDSAEKQLNKQDRVYAYAAFG